jgi:hypothetical protein
MKKKLKISRLDVQSFVTSLHESGAGTLKGGNNATTILNPESAPTICCSAVYPTIPVGACATTQTNALENCPCDVASRQTCSVIHSGLCND